MLHRYLHSFWALFLLSAGAGAALGWALPPYNYILAGGAFSVLLYAIIHSKQSWHSTCFGWVFGFAFYGLSLSWVANALTFDAQFDYLIPICKFGIPAFLGLYSGAVAGIAKRSRFAGISLWLLFAALWAGMEYIKNIVGFSFPWNIVGYAWTQNLEILQSTALVGIHTLSLLSVLLWTIPLLLTARHGKPALLSIAVLFCLLYGWGLGRLDHASKETQPYVIRLVQPNVSQSNKIYGNANEDDFARLLRLSATPTNQKIAAVIWPESAAPYGLDQDATARKNIMQQLPLGADLITGISRLRIDMEQNKEVPANSLMVVHPSGDITGFYDKHFLVPFGEYVPLRRYLKMAKVTPGIGDFARGVGVQTLALSDVPAFSPLICYEAVYSGQVVDERHRPQWLLTISNDAWYGDSAGPYQHAEFAKVRAIEEGLPIVRVANTGISYVADSYGRQQGITKLDTEAVVDLPLPVALENPPFFARYGNMLFATMLGGCVFVAFYRNSFCCDKDMA
jgi:apolipoprotein N-acyltransferase